MTSLAISRFTGDLLEPGDAAYDAARRVHNAAVDRAPAAIARCAGEHDVAAALRHAHARGLPVTVRGGGHASGGFAVGDGAVMLDLSRLDAIEVDAARRRARVQGGALCGALDAATQVHGLAMTGARMPSVGVAGFTLGSGSGWLERKLGLAADSLRSARLVTAGGDVVTAGPEQHPGLFWALRGGGPGFGVVVELEFELAPIGPHVRAGLLGWPLERAADVVRSYAALMADAPDDLGGGLAFLDAPPLPFVPAEMQGSPVVAVLVLWTGAPDALGGVLAPLRALGAGFDAIGPQTYAALQGMFERPLELQEPTRVHQDGGFLGDLPAEAAIGLAQLAAERPSPLGSILLQPLGGAFARAPEDATPLGRRDAAWHWQAGAAWTDVAADQRSRAWIAAIGRALAPWSAGETYPNFIAATDPDRLRAAYAPATWERLRAVRAEWDPGDVFAAGHAVPLPG